MSNEKRSCPLCNSSVTILDGMREVPCTQCGNVIRIDGDKAKKGRHFKLLSQAVILVLLIAALVGIWVYIGTRDSGGSQSSGIAQSASKWIENISGEPRAFSTGKIYFDLFEFHADDTVRIGTILTVSEDEGKQSYLRGPWLHSYDDQLSAAFINCQLVNQYSSEVEYRGATYYYYNYIINVSSSHYGCDILTSEAYLHVRETDRLLSIGCDPTSYFDQCIVAIAIPQAATVTSIYDYQPYRHITLGEWDIFYYDVTDITSHVSIHIAYVSGEDAPKLDWAAAEAAR